jgi:hypothetical protein
VGVNDNWAMIVIKCGKCKRKIIKYRKLGAGRVLRCFKERIERYYQEPVDGDLVCECGEVIGTDCGNWYQMKQGNFVYTGKVIK